MRENVLVDFLSIVTFVKCENQFFYFPGPEKVQKNPSHRKLSRHVEMRSKYALEGMESEMLLSVQGTIIFQSVEPPV